MVRVQPGELDKGPGNGPLRGQCVALTDNAASGVPQTITELLHEQGQRVLELVDGLLERSTLESVNWFHP